MKTYEKYLKESKANLDKRIRATDNVMRQVFDELKRRVGKAKGAELTIVATQLAKVEHAHRSYIENVVELYNEIQREGL